MCTTWKNQLHVSNESRHYSLAPDIFNSFLLMSLSCTQLRDKSNRSEMFKNKNTTHLFMSENKLSRQEETTTPMEWCDNVKGRRTQFGPLHVTARKTNYLSDIYNMKLLVKINGLHYPRRRRQALMYRISLEDICPV